MSQYWIGLWIFVTSYRKPKQTFWSTQYFMPFYCQIISHCLIAILSIHSLAKGLLSCFYFFLVWMKLLWTIVYEFFCGHLSTRTGIAGSYSDSPFSQGAGVEGHVLIFSCENSKPTTRYWTTFDWRMLDPTKKRYPMSKAKEKPQQDGRRDKIMFRIKHLTYQRQSEGSNKPCVHQDPETPQKLGQNCVWVSPAKVRVSSGLPQGQRLWVQKTWLWHKPSWRRSPLTPP